MYELMLVSLNHKRNLIIVYNTDDYVVMVTIECNS